MCEDLTKHTTLLTTPKHLISPSAHVLPSLSFTMLLPFAAAAIAPSQDAVNRLLSPPAISLTSIDTPIYHRLSSGRVFSYGPPNTAALA